MLECSEKAKDPCEIGFCNEATGECDIRISETCTACDYNKSIDCSSLNTKCASYICAAVDDTSYAIKCVEHNLCQSTDPCTNVTCDPEIGCITAPRCPPKPCHTVQCDPNLEDLCNYTSLCPEGYICDDKISACVPDCPQKPCETFMGTTVENGVTKCLYEPVVCQDLSKCIFSMCNNETGQCDYYDNSSLCDKGDPCKIYSCNAYVGCMEEDRICDSGDDDPCVVSQCVPDYDDSTGLPFTCEPKPKCPNDKFCEKVTCSAIGECIYSNYSCEDMDTSHLDSDHKYVCNEERRSCMLIYTGGGPFDDHSSQSTQSSQSSQPTQSIQYSGSSKECEEEVESHYVEITIEGKHIDEQKIREMLSNFTSSTFSFHTINYEDGSGNTKVIVKFDEVSQAKKFVEEVSRQDTSKEQVVLGAKSVKVNDNSFSSSLTALFSFFYAALFF